MINVTEIMKSGAENRKLPPWVNMRHAWMVNDGLQRQRSGISGKCCTD